MARQHKPSRPVQVLTRHQLREKLQGCSATRTGEVFVSKCLSERIFEEAGRRIYESQQSRLSDQATLTARRAWRSDDVPEKFWDSFVEDARAALSVTSTTVVLREEHATGGLDIYNVQRTPEVFAAFFPAVVTEIPRRRDPPA